jgi:hypothetical protein
MIPTSIVTSGNKSIAVMYIGVARTEMRKLEARMERRRKDIKEDSSTTKIDGVVIECWANHSLRQIRITAPDGLRNKDKINVVKNDKKECPCFPHFSLGIIVGVTPEIPSQEDFEYIEDYVAALDEYNKFIITGRFQYDIEICNTDRYILFEGAFDANFGRYYFGQYVLVSIFSEMESWDIPLDCDRECLIDIPRFEELMVTPIHILEGMKEWWKKQETKKTEYANNQY